jgi:hypothetical protein
MAEKSIRKRHRLCLQYYSRYYMKGDMDAKITICNIKSPNAKPEYPSSIRSFTHSLLSSTAVSSECSLGLYSGTSLMLESLLSALLSALISILISCLSSSS